MPSRRRPDSGERHTVITTDPWTGPGPGLRPDPVLPRRAPSLERFPIADGLDPHAAAPLSVDGAEALSIRWHERRVDSPQPRQYRILIPVDGGPPRLRLGEQLSRQLDALWVAVPRGDGPRITSVVALFVPRQAHAPAGDGPGHQLMIMLTTDREPAGLDLDSAAMAGHVRGAIVAAEQAWDAATVR